MIRTLLCATDAGGARNLAALLPELSRIGAEITFVTRASFLHLMPSRMPEYRSLFAKDVEGKVEATFASLAPKAVICGTTRYDSPDRDFLRCARQEGVRSVAVLDEWFNYRDRFSVGGRIEYECVPDAIALPDDQAVREGVAEGLPPLRCHATGSPSLATMWKIGERWKVTPPHPPPELDGRGTRPVVTFLSETHGVDYGNQPGESGLMGPYIGYTESSVRDSLLSTLSLLPREILFVEKLHPAAAGAARPKSVPANVEYRLSHDAPTMELCIHSEAVVGMRSMSLLEARLLRCNVASFQPGRVGPERCTAVRLGLVPGIHGTSALYTWLVDAIVEARTAIPMDRPFFAREEGAEQIVQLALGARDGEG